MEYDTLKNELRVLADAQLLFEQNNWNNIGSIQREPYSNSLAWGTIFEKQGRKFFLNIKSAPKAAQFIDKQISE